MNNRLIIHERLNINAQRVNVGESLLNRLNSEKQRGKGKIWKNFVCLQVWIMKNNIIPNRLPTPFPF